VPCFYKFIDAFSFSASQPHGHSTRYLYKIKSNTIPRVSRLLPGELIFRYWPLHDHRCTSDSVIEHSKCLQAPKRTAIHPRQRYRHPGSSICLLRSVMKSTSSHSTYPGLQSCCIPFRRAQGRKQNEMAADSEFSSSTSLTRHLGLNFTRSRCHDSEFVDRSIQRS
jgi:hypothetical protein